MSELAKGDLDALLELYDSDRVYASLGDSGWSERSSPESGEEPSLPENLDELSIEELRHLHSKFGAWYNYLCNRAVILSSQVEILGKQVGVVYSYLYLQYKDYKKEEREARIQTDPSYVKVDSMLMSFKAMLASLEMRRKALHEGITVLSRQASMIMSDMQITSRTGGYGD